MDDNILVLNNGFCDFPDLAEPPVQIRDEKPYYLDNVSKIFRMKTPEETVRQKMVIFLHEMLHVPYSAMRVEEHLAHYIEHTNKRMDICILAENEDGTSSPVLIVECKAPSRPITDDVYDQADYYAWKLNVFVVCVTNGHTIRFLVWDEEINEYRVPTKLPTYEDLCSTANLSAIDQNENSYERPAFSSIYSKERYEEALDFGIIGEDTPLGYAPFILNLYDSLMDETQKVRSIDVMPYRFEYDGGTHYTEFGDASGGSFDGVYRLLSVLDEKDVSHFINFGVFSVAKTENSPRFGNSRGRTILTVAISGLQKAHSSLQLTLDDHVILTDKTAYISHNGRMAVGNIGSANSNDVLNYVIKSDPKFELKNGKIYLGKIDYSKPLSVEQPDMLAFISNLVRYSLLRDEYRQIIKNRRKGNS